MVVKKAVITAAGQGTRMLPCTQYYPKEMLAIGNTPIIDFIIEECYIAGIQQICIVYSSAKNLLIKRIEDLKKNYEKYKEVEFYFIEQNHIYGTASAVLSTLTFVNDEPFYLIFPDEIFFQTNNIAIDLINAYHKTEKNIVCARRIPYENCYKYGIISYAKKQKNLYQVKKIVEKPQFTPPSNLAICGRFILNKKIFKAINQLSFEHEFYLTDPLNILAEQDELISYEINNTCFDTGNQEDYIITQIKYLLSKYQNKPLSLRLIKDRLLEIIEQEN